MRGVGIFIIFHVFHKFGSPLSVSVLVAIVEIIFSFLYKVLIRYSASNLYALLLLVIEVKQVVPTQTYKLSY